MTAIKKACGLQQDSEDEKKVFLVRIKEIVLAHRLCKVDCSTSIDIPLRYCAQRQATGPVLERAKREAPSLALDEVSRSRVEFVPRPKVTSHTMRVCNVLVTATWPTTDQRVTATTLDDLKFAFSFWHGL